MLTHKIPRFIRPHQSIPTTIFHVIEKMTEEDENDRFQNCNDLKKELILAFDLILGRNNDMGTLFKNWKTLNPAELQTLLTNVKQMPFEKKMSFMDDIALITAEKISSKDEYVPVAIFFIAAYHDIIDSMASSRKRIDFSYAEYITKVMAILFRSLKISINDKAKALEVALTISIRFNRIAAEKVCGNLIESIDNDGLALLCARVIDDVATDGFLEYHVSAYECSHPLIQDLVLKANRPTSL